MNLMNKIKALWTWFFAPFDEEFVRGASDIPPTAGAYARQKQLLLVMGIVLVCGILVGALLGFLLAFFIFQFVFPAFFMVWVTGVVVVFFCLMRFAAQRANNWSRGMQGEIIAANKLAEIMRDKKWHVFHGLRILSIGDIDHIIVSPKGVFAIETKTPRGIKIFYENGEVRVDDRPPLRNPNPIKQAKRNAAKLSELIGQKTGMSVWVTPIVCFPGMFVDSKEANPEVMVMNQKQIRSSLPSEDSLSEDQIRKIADALGKEIRGQ